MKEIPVTQGKVALVDDEDFKELSKHKWYAQKTSYGTFIAVRSQSKKRILMHRQIMDCPQKMYVDHRNHDTLDNRRQNLRVCTNSQNQQNQLPLRGNSKYKGVCWIKNRKKWVARIQLNGKRTYLGHFTDEIKAAKAYDQAAKEMFGEFAKTNF